jgi:succinate dehydrogenase/fumarate reductase cytochrome b subunit
MTNHPYRLSKATVLLQSTSLFFITFLLLATAHLWDETYVTMLQGVPLPGLTQWVQSIAPKDITGLACLALIVAMTHGCCGITLVTTAKSDLKAAERVALLSTATWGLTLLCSIVVIIAQALPFVTVIGRLSPDDGIAYRVPLWVIGTTVYCLGMVLIAIRICRANKKEVEQNKD